MDEDDKKRTNIEDLPRAEEDVTDDEAKNVQGGANTYTGATTVQGGSLAKPQVTIGGTLGVDQGRKMGDGSV